MRNVDTSKNQFLNDLRKALSELMDDEKANKSSYSRLEDIIKLGEEILEVAPIATSFRWSGLGSLVFNILTLAIALVAWIAPNPSYTTTVLLGALITWCIALLISIVALRHARIDWRTWVAVGTTTIGAIAVGAILFRSPLSQHGGEPINQQNDSASWIESAAWQLYSEKSYENALALTDIYLKTFGDDARKLQAGLTAQGEQQPDLIHLSDSEKQQLLVKNVKLNAAASCNLLRGRIFEMTGRKADALTAYQAVIQMPNAISIDRTAPGSLQYLAPIDEARRRIADLNRT